MKKRYEDYSLEEIKAAMLDPIQGDALISYIYDDVIKILYNKLYLDYKEQAEHWLVEVYEKFVDKVIDGSFKGGEKEKPLQALKSYWVTMAFYDFLNLWRKEQHDVSQHIDISEYEKVSFNDLDTDRLIENEDDLLLLAKAMNDSRLQDKCRDLIQARFYEDKSYEEIFQENPSLSASVPALRKKMGACIEKFRSIFTTLN